MKKQAGFTLIELVIVIIILGILAVTAAPKFLNLQDDARDSTIKGVQGAFSSSAAMVYSKAVLQGDEKAASGKSITVDGKAVALVWGYPAATSAALTAVTTLDGNDWTFGTAASGSIRVFPAQQDTTQDKCYVQYQVATSTAAPIVTTKSCK